MWNITYYLTVLQDGAVSRIYNKSNYGNAIETISEILKFKTLKIFIFHCVNDISKSLPKNLLQ